MDKETNENCVWKLFRQEVEYTEVPREITDMVRQGVEQLTVSGEEKENE